MHKSNYTCKISISLLWNFEWSVSLFKTKNIDSVFHSIMFVLPCPAIIQHSLVHICTACSIVNRWLSLWFGVHLMLSSHKTHILHLREILRTGLKLDGWTKYFACSIIGNKMIKPSIFICHISHRHKKSARHYILFSQ